METVGKVTLHQEGWFVAKLQFAYRAGNTWKHVDGSGNIPIAQKATLDPGDYGVPKGAEFSPYVFVVWGNDQRAHEVFQYEKGNSFTAEYTIRGRTLDNSLEYEGKK
jgi:hypothetical protein